MVEKVGGMKKKKKLTSIFHSNNHQFTLKMFLSASESVLGNPPMKQDNEKEVSFSCYPMEFLIH